VTIDAGAPTSHVLPLPATTTNPLFLVQWTGQDDNLGSGVASFDIYVSDNGAPAVLWLQHTPDSQATYHGLAGRTYAFYSLATDHVGNQQLTHADTVSILVQASSTSPPPLGQGYWKKPGIAWPVATLTLGGYTYTKTELLALLAMPTQGDARIILVSQLIAAKLNLANGSDPAPILAVIQHADGLLSGLGKIVAGSTKVKPSTPLGQLMVLDAAVLDKYNSGALV
jgi:hypothetical protein